LIKIFFSRWKGDGHRYYEISILLEKKMTYLSIDWSGLLCVRDGGRDEKEIAVNGREEGTTG